MKIATIAKSVVVLGLVVGGVLLSGILDPDYELSAVDHATTQPDQALLAKGRYLAQAADCTACHTSKDGAPFAGGVPLPTPFGTLYGTNITPDPEHGIGNWSSADFYKALHDGIAPHGPLYPAMPYTSYRGLSRDESDAIFAYLRSIEPAPIANQQHEIPFPFNLRFLMRGWNLLFLHDSLPMTSEGNSHQWVRGQHLVNVLGHCSECHTPRGMLGQLQLSHSLKGGAAEAIHAPDITPTALAQRGWTQQDLQQFLAQGIAPQGTAYGGMYDAFHHSTQHLSETDHQAIAQYLTGDVPQATVALTPADTAQRESVSAGRNHYLALCAGCHSASGEGKPNVTVALYGNSTLRNPDPHNLLQVMLHGLEEKDFPNNRSRQAMPGFAGALSNAQFAELANYLRVEFGGQKGDITAESVAAQQ